MIDNLEAQLNATHGTRWDTYRRSDGDWNIVVKDDKLTPRQISVHAPTLTEAMALAVDVRFIPQVPRRPHLESYYVEKINGTWTVQIVGLPSGYGTTRKTKKEAEATAQRATERSRERWDEWHRDWLPVTTSGVEGVDWEYER